MQESFFHGESPNLEAEETSRDYIFRYPLDLESKKDSVYHHRLTELVRAVLEDMLNLVVPVNEGKDVKIDGFRWLMDKERVHQIFEPINNHDDYRDSIDKYPGLCLETRDGASTFQSGLNASFYEPRIDLIKRLTESILTLVEFEQKDQVVKIDGFRLKSLKDWLVPSAADPAEVFEYAASHCTCDCTFCCNKGNPSLVAPCYNLKRTAMEELSEMRTRMKYLRPAAQNALFPSIGTIYEVLAHPYIMDILRSLRENNSLPFRITTNGNTLSPEVVAKLAELKPIYLYLSLNSSSPSRRHKLMRDPKPEIAINSLSLLKQHRIPYAAVIVPWPVDTMEEMLEDLSSTAAYAIEHEPHIIQVNLPGYSRYFSSSEIFDLDKVWRAIVSRVRELREKHDYPIVVMPPLYEENIYQSRKNLPQIIGLIKNSPAYFGGLKRGDLILEVNHIRTHNRPQTRDLLSILRTNEAKETTLKVQRENDILEVKLDLTRYSYPYSKELDDYLGVIFMGSGLRTSYLEDLKAIIDNHQAKRVLFLSSELVKPTFEQCLAESHLFSSQVEIAVKVPKNLFFGGNIFMGDLLVVQDLIDCIKEYIMSNEKPDLVVITSSPFNLSGWGRDLTGRVYLDVERQTGVPVELLHCATMYN
ncbi:MAG: radical SAM protein [Chloroflexota bacterium]